MHRPEVDNQIRIRSTEADKLVLLDFYSEELWEDDIPPMMNKILIPEGIDEVWRTKRDLGLSR